MGVVSVRHSIKKMYNSTMIMLPLFLSNSLLFLILIGISVKDYREGIIPDILLGLLALLGILRFGGMHILSALIVGGIAYGLYKMYPLLRKTEGLGWGDVKMMMVSGLWLKLFQIPLFLMVSGVIGVSIASKLMDGKVLIKDL
jgi:Flp pilus assembly protein protease CpaA